MFAAGQLKWIIAQVFVTVTSWAHTYLHIHLRNLTSPCVCKSNKLRKCRARDVKTSVICLKWNTYLQGTCKNDHAPRPQIACVGTQIQNVTTISRFADWLWTLMHFWNHLWNLLCSSKRKLISESALMAREFISARW